VAAFGVKATGVAATGVAATGVAATGVAATGVAATGVAAAGVAADGVAGRAERLGWNPGPPARPRRAWVAPSALGVGLDVSGEDQDPSGSRRGEGTALAARQGLA